MTNYLYVKSGGTATGTAGKYTSAKTGSWSTAFSSTAEYYDNLGYCISQAALTSGTEDTYIFVSDEHNYVVTVTGYTNINSTNPNLKVLSVDNDDLSVPSPGGKETFNYTGTNFILIRPTLFYCYGMIFEISDRVIGYINDYNSNTAYQIPLWENCTWIHRSGNYSTNSSVIYTSTRFLNCTFDLGNTPTTYVTHIGFREGYYYQFRNCTFIGWTTTSYSVFKEEYNGAISNIDIEGCDFSQCNRPLFNVLGSSNLSRILTNRNNEATNTRYNRLVDTRINFLNGYFLSGSSKYGSITYNYLGDVETSTSVYRNNGASYDGVNYFSYKVTTTSTTISSVPFTFKLCDFYFKPNKNHTIKIEFARDLGGSAFTQYNLFLELYYKELGTSKFHKDTTLRVCPMNAVNLSTSSESWTGLITPTKQYITLSPSKSGDFEICSVYIGCTLPSVVFYICPKVDIS